MQSFFSQCYILILLFSACFSHGRPPAVKQLKEKKIMDYDSEVGNGGFVLSSTQTVMLLISTHKNVPLIMRYLTCSTDDEDCNDKGHDNRCC
jgi:hypothetical protein